MLVVMGVSLYTSRVVLDSLGIENYGIYNVVGGIVIMFSMISGPISNAIQRYFTFELGSGNKEKLRAVFSTAVSIEFFLSAVIVLLCEIIGYWFLNSKMSIPEDRLDAANFVLQCTFATFVVNILNAPYNAAIVAHERMGVYAYFTIFEVVMKLIISYLIYISPFDKLKVYALLLFSVSLLLQLLYRLYCKKYFEETRGKWELHWDLFKEMLKFAGWTFFGNSAYIVNTQGVNMLINVFFGVKVNAARAIAVQFNSAAIQFVNGFLTAINPQITKSYASDEKEYLYLLICRGSKFSYMILYLLIIPVVFEANAILSFWLKEVPPSSQIFVQHIMFGVLFTSIGAPMITCIQATGNIKKFQIISALIGFAVFPLTWIFYSLKAPAYSTYVIYNVVYFLINFYYLFTLKKMISFPIGYYIKHVLMRMIVFSSLSLIPSILINYFFADSIQRLVLLFPISIIWSLLCIYFVGLDKEERLYLKNKVNLSW